MATSIGDRVRDRSAIGFVGRTQELRALLDAVTGDQTFVVHVHGVPGIGKSSLVARFAHDARDAGAAIIELDGRTLEPTDRGIHDALASSLGCEGATPKRLYARLGEVAPRTVIVIDHYEVLRLIDTWLRQVFVPSLPDTARVVLASREPPVAGWLTAPELTGAVEVLNLGRLERSEGWSCFGAKASRRAPLRRSSA